MAAVHDASDRFAEHLAQEWSRGRVTTVAWLNHHGALRAHRAEMAALDGMDYVGIDGQLLLSLLGGQAGERTSADLVLPRLLPRLDGVRIALVGGRRPSLDRAAEVFSDQLATAPNSAIVSVCDGYAQLPGSGDMASWLESCRPDLVIVGLGAGLQEQWALEVSSHLKSGLVVTCGGFFDQVHQPGYYPPWAYRWRLNWAARLARDPRRLWRRYTIEAGQAVRARHALAGAIMNLPGFGSYRAVMAIGASGRVTA